jgi:galactose mutarotase-like enzyme
MRNHACRISDEFTYRGLRMLVMENEIVRVSILLDKGADIIEFRHKPSDTDFMLQTPLGVRLMVNNFDMVASPVGPFPDYYEGGWQELVPNGGRLCTYKGAAMGMHGEVWGQPWKCAIVEDCPGVVSAKLSVRTIRTPFDLEKTLTLRSGSAVLEIDERLTNESPVVVDLMWGHHPAFGAPFLDASTIVQCAAKKVVVDPSVGEECRFSPLQEFPWPKGPTRFGGEADISIVTPPEDRISDMTYLTDLEEGWYAVTNRNRQAGFGMSWDMSVFPHIWLWQSLGGDREYPSWGNTYAMAVEPFSSFPAILGECMKYNRQMVMQPGETRQAWLKAVAYGGVDGVRRIDKAGKVVL